MKRLLSFILLTFVFIHSDAQIGEHRNIFSVGVNGGYALNKVTFQPTVTQDMHEGITGGISFRYTCEKYFSTLCAIQAEVNYAQLGWKESILTISDTKVINPETGMAEEYKRSQNYIQIPVFAHLSWGKEKNGINGFINLGPQLGFLISETTHKNYNTPYITSPTNDGRVNSITAQENMPAENKFDYGIAVGAGIELHVKSIGRFDLEGRYYYGLGNIYGDSKRDYFGVSNHTTIFIKLSYLYDL